MNRIKLFENFGEVDIETITSITNDILVDLEDCMEWNFKPAPIRWALQDFTSVTRPNIKGEKEYKLCGLLSILIWCDQKPGYFVPDTLRPPPPPSREYKKVLDRLFRLYLNEGLIIFENNNDLPSKPNGQGLIVLPDLISDNWVKIFTESGVGSYSFANVKAFTICYDNKNKIYNT